MNQQAISNRQTTHPAFLAAGLVLVLLIALSMLQACNVISAQVSPSSMEHSWSGIELSQDEHHCHHAHTSRDVLAKLKNAKLELKPDFILYQALSVVSLSRYQSSQIQTSASPPFSSAPLFLLTQRMRI